MSEIEIGNQHDPVKDLCDQLCEKQSIITKQDIYRFAIQLRSIQKDTWQPIETAPKDGTDFLAYVDGCRTLVHYGKVSHVPIYGWIDLVGDPENRDLCNPTHWMPLPTPPNS